MQVAWLNYIFFLLVPAVCRATPCTVLVRPSLGAPLETLASVPRVECAPASGDSAFGVFSEVSNTSVLEPQYAFDAELFQTTFSSAFSLSEHVDLIAALPLRSRSAGILDSAIRGWHDTFGLPSGDSEDFSRNSYSVRQRRSDGTRYSYDKHELTLANAMVGATGELETLGAIRWILTTSLPTAVSDSGHRGVNTHLDVRRSFVAGRWSFSGSAGSSVIGDTETAGVRFNRFLWRVQPGIRYQVFERLAIEALFQWERTAVRDLPGYPGDALWTDVRVIIGAGTIGNFMVSLREDLGGANAQADLVGGLSWLTNLSFLE